MIATAGFAHRPWTPGEFDHAEDLLHSVAATGIGFALALGVVAAALWRARWHMLDVIALVASVAVPLGMSAWPEIDGATQRLMFVVAYAWYGTEAVREIREPHRPCRDRRSRTEATVSAS